jgi:hypothetical protein
MLSLLLVGALAVGALGVAGTAMASTSPDLPAATGTPSPASRASLLTMPALLDEGTRELAAASPPGRQGQPMSGDRKQAIANATAMFAEAALRAKREPADRKAAADWARNRDWTAEWAARLSDLHSVFDLMSSEPPPAPALVEQEAARLGLARDLKGGAPVSAEATAAQAAILLQAEIDILLDITGPVLAQVPEDNAVFHMVEPYVMFRDPQDLDMISPYQPVSEANKPRLMSTIRRFALRYPSIPGGKDQPRAPLRVATAWAGRDSANGTFARLGTHSKGLPERALSNMVVEDMLAVWKGRVPAAVHWRKRHVLLYSNETNLTNPDNGALVMLLLGSAILFGGLAWALYVARRGRPGNGDPAADD